MKSFSRVNSYITCPYQHYLTYVECWNPKKEPRSFSVGSAIHKCGEAYFKGNLDTFDFDITDEIDLRKWLELYKKYSTITKDYEVISVEKVFKFRGFKGIIDALLKSKKTGKYWLYERKTFSKKPDEFDRIFRPQPYIYYQQLKNKGIEVEGVVWEYNRSELPKEPELLKSGKLSQARTQSIIPDTIISACEKYGLNVLDYQDLIEYSKVNIQNYFDVKERYITPDVAERIFNEFNAIRINNKNKKKHMNTMICKGCMFRDVCLAELTGADEQFILEENFERKRR